MHRNLKLSAWQTRRLRFRAQGLCPSGTSSLTSPVEVLKNVVGVQAQDLPAGRLSIWARSSELTATTVERARQEQASIAWTWAMRGTLHLVSAEDATWLIPVLGPVFIPLDQRRLQQLGWDEERLAAGLHLLREALASGPATQGLTRAEIAQLLEQEGLPSSGQAPFHLIYRAALEGLLCAGPDRNNETTYVRFDSWLGKLQPLPANEGRLRLARRYLRAYAPAGPQDLASWSGLKLGEVRQTWEALKDELVQVEAAGQPAWLLPEQRSWLDYESGEPSVRLLPRYDTYLLGYANRSLAVEAAFEKRVHPGGGLLSAVLLVDGQALGTWKTRRRKARLEVLVEPFQGLADELIPLVEAQVANMGRFLEEETLFVLEKG